VAPAGVPPPIPGSSAFPATFVPGVPWTLSGVSPISGDPERGGRGCHWNDFHARRGWGHEDDLRRSISLEAEQDRGDRSRREYGKDCAVQATPGGPGEIALHDVLRGRRLEWVARIEHRMARASRIHACFLGRCKDLGPPMLITKGAMGRSVPTPLRLDSRNTRTRDFV